MRTDSAASPLSKGFTGWKFDLLDAIARDQKVAPVDFHIAYVVVQHVNQYTRVAEISDRKLQQLVHRNRSALTLFRKRFIALGWLNVRIGRYGKKATEYRFLDGRAKMLENIRLDEQILNDEEADNEVKTPIV